MEIVVLVIHLFIALAMTGVILLQKSEGGALGIGGGGGAGGLGVGAVSEAQGDDRGGRWLSGLGVADEQRGEKGPGAAHRLRMLPFAPTRNEGRAKSPVHCAFARSALSTPRTSHR